MENASARKAVVKRFRGCIAYRYSTNRLTVKTESGLN